jgi:hypothetical protein
MEVGMAQRREHWGTRFLLIVTVLFQGLSGLLGGVALVVEPSGALVGIPQAWLEGSPFPDYRIPGVVLLVVLGAAPVAVAWALWSRQPWALRAAFSVGVALLVWIGIEIAVIGYHRQPPLQFTYGLLGLGIIALSTTARARERAE